MVLHLLTKLFIFQPSTKIQSLRRFDLDLLETLKGVYRWFKYDKKCKDQRLSFFPRKIVLSKFDIFKPCKNIQLLRRFDKDFWKSSEQIYTKLQYWEKCFGKFQGLPRFLRKNGFEFVKQILYFWAFYQFSTSQNFRFRIFIYFIFQYGEKILENFMICLVFPEKWFCIHSPNLVFSSLAQKLRCRHLTDFK